MKNKQHIMSLLANTFNKNPLAFKDSFKQIIANKIMDKIATKKQQMANTIVTGS